MMVLSFSFVPALARATAEPVRERLSLDADWRFTKGDPEGTGEELRYKNIKPWVNSTGNEFVKDGQPVPRPKGNLGEDVAYAQPGFDDSHWRQLKLPHDWGIEGPFNPDLPGATGRLHWWGIGWYRKHFKVAASDQDRRFYLDVDGAMSYANVWLNGHYVGGWPYGYSSWELDLTPYIKFGVENIIAIRLDNPPESSRWYPGGGIYRNVWLVKTGPVHVKHWGTYVTTPQVSDDQATVNLQITVENDLPTNANAFVETQIYERTRDGKKGRPLKLPHPTLHLINLPAGRTYSTKIKFDIPRPQLWSLDNPNMYIAETTIAHPLTADEEPADPTVARHLKPNGGALEMWDRYETPFGIRTIKFDASKGFFLNGKHVHLNGVCDHADLGALGTAINVRALQRQVEWLQEMGCNAIRTSHNPPAPELLDLCDRMGVLVMDESFDCWERGKTKNDYHLLFDDWHEKDWRAELRRDRNHPSIILWSIGNEVPDQRTPAGPRIAARN